MVDKDAYDFQTVCTLCQCAEGTHIQFHSCPILEDNPICSTDCCIVACLKTDVAIRFSQVLGRNVSLEQVNEACKKCGRNYACQNEKLAKEMERSM